MRRDARRTDTSKFGGIAFLFWNLMMASRPSSYKLPTLQQSNTIGNMSLCIKQIWMKDKHNEKNIAC